MATTISGKGWVVIPAELRKKYNLTPGKGVQIVDYGGVLAIVPALEDPIHQASGMLATKEERKKMGRQKQSLVDVLLEEHRQELSHE